MSENDAYCYPGTDVLRNNENIRDAAKLQKFEYQRTLERSLELQENPIQGNFDLKHLQAIHKHLFQDVYPWAGENRNVNIAKGSSHFCRWDYIESFANSDVFKNLKKDNLLVGLEKEAFTDRLAHHYAEINALHPFREGNGRSTRQFIEQLAIHAGYDLDYSKVDGNRWNDAARESFSGSTDAMKRVFADIARPAKAISFEHDRPEDAIKKYPDLMNAFKAIQAAEDIAKHQFSTPAEQQHAVGSFKETLKKYIEQNRVIQDIKIKDRPQPPSPDIDR